MKRFNRTTCLAVAVLGLGLAACAHRGEPVSQAWSDKMTTRRVNAELKQSPVYKFPNVQVTTHEGIVALNGFVNTDQQKKEAVQRTQGAAGVREIVDNLVIQTAPTGRPPVVEHPREINPQKIPQSGTQNPDGQPQTWPQNP